MSNRFVSLAESTAGLNGDGQLLIVCPWQEQRPPGNAVFPMLCPDFLLWIGHGAVPGDPPGLGGDSNAPFLR